MKLSSFIVGLAASLAVTAAFGQNETDRFIAGALAKAQREKDTMLFCFNWASIKFAVQTCEPAETVVEAAYGACYQAERAYADALVKSAGISRNVVIDGLTNGKQYLRPSLLAVVLRSRANSGRCAGN